MTQESGLPEIKLDATQLYREDTFTDRRAGTLRRLTPVTANGDEDSSRPVIYEGAASLMTPGGALPLQFPIEAGSLEEALEKFPELAQQNLQDTLEELRKMQREAQSSLVVPGRGGPGGGMGGPGGMGGLGGGMPGGGKIQL